MIPMNTWKRAPLTKLEKQQIKQPLDPIEQQKQTHKNKTHTWIHPTGHMARQIDYIMVNNRYRNTDRRAWAEQGRRGNMNQQRQRAVIQMDIVPKHMKGYHSAIPKEGGAIIQYDIQELRNAPHKLTHTVWKTDEKRMGHYQH